jgi:hypothetical protein
MSPCPPQLPKGVIVSPHDTLPLPNVDRISEVTPKKRRRCCTAIATSTSFIEDLKQQQLKARKQLIKVTKVRKHLLTESYSDSEIQTDKISLHSDTDSGSEFEPAPEPAAPVQIENLKEGNWIAVSYNGDLIPGKIVRRESVGFLVNCLEKTNKNFRWPKKKT